MIEHSRPIEIVPDAPDLALSHLPRRADTDMLGGVRSTDLMPYTGLRYLSTLFRIMALILLVVLVAEAIAGFTSQGSAALPTVLGEASRLIVLAGVLWGTGDLATLLIDMGHDVRAARIFLNRETAHAHPEGFVADRPSHSLDRGHLPVMVRAEVAQPAELTL